MPWNTPHRSAGVVLSDAPGVVVDVWVVITWSGTSPQGELVDRNVSSVHLTRTGQNWRSTAIVSGPPTQ